MEVDSIVTFLPVRMKQLILSLFIVLLLTGRPLPANSPAVDSLAASRASAATISLRTYVEEGKVPLNRMAHFYVELSWMGKMSRYQIPQIPQPILTNLMMQGSGSSNRLEETADGEFRATKTISYQLQPVAMGMAYIDGLSIRYTDTVTGETSELQSQRVALEVVDPLPDSSGSGLKAIVYVVLLSIFAVTVLYFLILYFRRRRQARKAVPQEICPAEASLSRLSSEIDPHGRNLAEMTSRLSRILREYLMKAYQIPTGELAAAEVSGRLTDAGLGADEAQKMGELFEKFDVIKFSGAPVNPAEFSLLYGAAESFLLARKKEWQLENDSKKEA